MGDAKTGFLKILDQRELPQKETHLECRAVKEAAFAIKTLAVRGAPAIGVAAAFGCVLGAQRGKTKEAIEELKASRPTAVNLFWALNRIRKLSNHDPETVLQEARKIEQYEKDNCLAIGRHGLALLKNKSRAMTICNTGALCTGGIGTAVAPFFLAHAEGRPIQVYALETRPLLQGARLTAWELSRAGIDVTLICDGAAAHTIREKKIEIVIAGADRIAANGDSANKVGTYALALAAHYHKVPFYIAAPSSSFDLATPSGDQITIEERSKEEVTRWKNTPAAPDNISVFNPAFDVTPNNLIAGIITEKGLIHPPYKETIAKILK
ncbi:MAG: S-methyl-5-thioribose-1-phosphate isomerase [Elusimicrobia bacterium]|nr:S-methyl-5-thioribose-1-phosphate isomerase [Elusimicrobiota bacterium]